jgi:hypothetical protein
MIEHEVEAPAGRTRMAAGGVDRGIAEGISIAGCIVGSEDKEQGEHLHPRPIAAGIMTSCFSRPPTVQSRAAGQGGRRAATVSDVKRYR